MSHPASDNASPHMAQHTTAQHQLCPHQLVNHPGNSTMAEFILRKLDRSCHTIACPTAPTRSKNHSFFYLTSGEVLLEIGDHTYLVLEHECVIIPSGQIFSIRYFKNSLGFMGSFSSDFLQINHQNPLKTYDFLRMWNYPKIKLTQEISANIEFLLNRTFQAYSLLHTNEMHAPTATMSSTQKLLLQSYLFTFLMELYCFQNNNTALTFVPDTLTAKFLEIVFQPENRKLMVAEYADLLHISPNHLNKAVKAATGKTASQWIEEAFILDAKVLLRNQELSLNQISEELGILDPSYFTKRFKKYEGITPSQFRTKNQ